MVLGSRGSGKVHRRSGLLSEGEGSGDAAGTKGFQFRDNSVDDGWVRAFDGGGAVCGGHGISPQFLDWDNEPWQQVLQ